MIALTVQASFGVSSHVHLTTYKAHFKNCQDNTRHVWTYCNVFRTKFPNMLRKFNNFEIILKHFVKFWNGRLHTTAT